MNLPTLTKQGDQGEYCLSGALDRDTVPTFWHGRAKWMPSETRVTINLSALSRVDSAGMAMLLHLQQALKKNEQILTFQNIPAKLSVLLELSNVADLFLKTTPSLDGE